jgi:hypothetical protein
MAFPEKRKDILRGEGIFSGGMRLDVAEGGHRRSLAHATGGATGERWHKGQRYNKD